MQRWFFVPFGLLLFGIITSFAASGVVIDTLLPNTADDANLEYVEVADISCFDVDLSGYVLRDASGKTYLLSGAVSSGARMRIGRPESKIVLNNTDERIDLLDASGELLDQFSYANSTKDVVISTGHYVLPSCQQPDSQATYPTDSGSVLTDTGTTLSDSGSSLTEGSDTWTGTALDSTGSSGGTSVSQTDTWATSSGSSDGSFSGSQAPPGAVLADTGITLSGSDPLGGSDIPVDSGSTLAQSGETVSASSGSVAETSADTGSSASADEQKLILEDLDSNGRIDRISVVYDAMLTGAIDSTKLVVYSATGGLSGTKIESSTGVFQALSLSGNLLVIDLIEGDIEHPNLEINATTSSHLRLKTYSGFWLRLSDGREAVPLTYTKSFHAYSGAYIENRAYVALPVLTTPASPSPSYSLPSPTALVILSHPLSDPTFQIQSGLTDRYECKSEPCKVNLSFVPKYDYERCNWIFEWGMADPKSLTSCNPKTVEFSPGDHDITLYVFEAGNPSNEISRTIRIMGKQVPIQKSPTVQSEPKPQAESPMLVRPLRPSLLHAAFDRLMHFGASEQSDKKTEKSPPEKTGRRPERKTVPRVQSKTGSMKKKASKIAANTKRQSSKRPKLLAKKKKPSPPKETASTVKTFPPDKGSEGLTDSERAVAASGLATLASAGGYVIGRRRKSPCGGAIAS